MPAFKLHKSQVVPAFIFFVCLAIVMTVVWRFQHNAMEAVEKTSAPLTGKIAAGNFRIGDVLPDFGLEALDGQLVTLNQARGRYKYLVVVTHDPGCPCAEQCASHLNDLIEEFPTLGVLAFMSEVADDDRTLLQLREQIAEHEFRFPVHLDRGHKVRRLLGATRTPEVWLLDSSGRILFWGAPENSLYPGRPGHRYFLREILTALARGEEAPFTGFPPFGCRIIDRAEQEVIHADENGL